MTMFQVLRAVMLLGKHRRRRGFKPEGGLLVLLWTETAASGQSLNCTGKPGRVYCGMLHHPNIAVKLAIGWIDATNTHTHSMFIVTNNINFEVIQNFIF